MKPQVILCNCSYITLYRVHLDKKLLSWKTQVHHHNHKFMELESALRRLLHVNQRCISKLFLQE